MIAASQTAMPLSISHLPAGSAWWIYAIVIATLALHIGGGSIAILSGFGALVLEKGAHLHRLFGKIFVMAMVLMAALGTVLSIPLHQRGNIAAGILAAYLVATAWMTVRRTEGTVGRFEKIAVLVPLGVGLLFLIWGVQATMNGGHLDGYRSPLYYVFAFIGALFASLDLNMIRQGGISGVRRIARHLWRMCFALFFAAASFFLGQQKVMPAFMHGSPILLALGLAPLAIMIFWLVRVRIGSRFGPQLASS
jgi:hypothetical protein